MTAGGSLIRALDHHASTPCDPQAALVAIDRDSGKVVDYYGVQGIAGKASVSADGAGLVHLWGPSARSSDPFAATSNAISRSGSAYLAHVDFSQKDQFVPACLVNAASFSLTRRYSVANLSTAPGEIISIFGTGLGPVDGNSAIIGANGIVPSELSGTSVQIGNTSLPLLYVSDRQVNAIAPYSLSIGTSNITIHSGSFQVSYEIEVAPAFPGVFTLDGSGSGPAAILNQDGSINSMNKPAARGSIVSIFTTGMGHLASSLPDNLVTPLSSPWPQTVEQFGVYVAAPFADNGAAMAISYSGPAPGLPPGVYQINAKIPLISIAGRTPIRFVFGPPGYDQTQFDVSIFVQ